MRESHILQAALLYNLQVIGEASSNLSDEIRERYEGVPWRSIVGLRNVIVHEYFEIDLDLVWTTVTKDVPALQRELEG